MFALFCIVFAACTATLFDTVLTLDMTAPTFDATELTFVLSVSTLACTVLI